MRPSTIRLAAVLTLGLGLGVGACGPKPAFTLTSAVDNDRGALSAALARRSLPSHPQPVNASGQPRLFAALGGAQHGLVAFDLAANKVLWKVDADLASRVAVGGDFVVAVEGKAVVARDQAAGAVRWKVAIGDTFGGLAADGKRAYYVHGDGDPGTWTLVGLDGASGKELWHAGAAGRLGAPEAHGGVVYSPFLHQWLTVVDGATGKELTRLRGLDEQLATLRVTSTAAYVGTKAGVFLVDERAASGKPADATFAPISVPAQLDRAHVGRDHYDPIQLGYSAADRARVLWEAAPGQGGALRFVGDGHVVHYFRFLFGYGADGALRWAYSHPRVELVASEHTGAVIAAVSAQGEVIALDPATGALRSRGTLGTSAPVVGATFDADGWAPSGAGEPATTIPALVAIAHDRDARFDRVKELAVASLAHLPGAEVTKDLLGLLDDERASLHLKDVVVEQLIARKDPTSLPVLTTSLAVHTDYIAGREPEALGPVAKAMAGLRGVELPASEVAPALAALQAHLDAPTTAIPELVQIIGALGALGKGAERPALISHLMLYHVDDEVGGDAGWAKAIIAALLDGGGPAERQALTYVAEDPRTVAGLATAVKEALAAANGR